jgi:hypothetical protein
MKRIDKMMYGVVFLFLTAPFTSHAQGPNAPEAASFEPVDATDMVNLVTGDFTYVLPLLNVPSPEGGYPLALAYHAGIAMDQEASWVGLGWSLNPGAINRVVNGYPDDYNGAEVSEYFFDRGDKEVVQGVSVGFMSPKGLSVGLSISWNSNQTFSGSVSLGIGLPVGEGALGISGTVGIKQESSAGVGYMSSTGLRFGATVSSGGDVGVRVGYGNDNGSGFSVGANTDGTYFASVSHGQGKENPSITSLGINFSLSSVGINVSHITGEVGEKGKSYQTIGSVGVGLNMSLNNAVSVGDYVTNSSSSIIPVFLPTPIGIFSLSYGKQVFEYHLATKKMNYVYGNQNFNENTRYEHWYKIKCTHESDADGIIWRTYEGLVEGETVKNEIFETYECEYYFVDAEPYDYKVFCNCEIQYEREYTAQMDVYEFPVREDYTMGKVSNLLNNNLIFPSYDKYNVQAQGLSGSMSSRVYENGNLFGLSGLKSQGGYELAYSINEVMSDLEDNFKFNEKPFFEFENEISSYLEVKEANIKLGSNNYQNTTDYYLDNVVDGAESRRQTGNFITHYTYKDIVDKYAANTLLGEGFLFSDDKLQNNLLFRPPLPHSATNTHFARIAAFKITAMDGKTYHYSLPVYNHETVSRTYGQFGSDTPQADGYYEKRQLEPYATHWLLTAVTGPDFVDINANGTPDVSDYGYWVRFEYGQWSNGFTWKIPYLEEHLTDLEARDIKTQIRGRKEVYYLDKIKTRTHTAVFVKERSSLEKSVAWNYSSVDHEDYLKRSSVSNYTPRFSIESEPTLQLKEILLIKNSDDTISSATGSSVSVSGYGFPQSSKESIEEVKQQQENKIISVADISNSIYTEALKKIKFNYDNNHFTGLQGPSGQPIKKTFLKEVSFGGKGGILVMPPYKFEYNKSFNSHVGAEGNEQDYWGYQKLQPENCSLKSLTSPTGSKMIVGYEQNSFYKPLIHKGREFHKGLNFQILTSPPYTQNYDPFDAPKYSCEIEISVDEADPDVGQQNIRLSDYFEQTSLNGNKIYIDLWLSATRNYSGPDYRRSAVNVLPQEAEVLWIDPGANKMKIEVLASSPFIRNGEQTSNRIFSAHRGQGNYNKKNSKKGRYDLVFAENPKWYNIDAANFAYSLWHTIVGNKAPQLNMQGGGVRVESISLEEPQITYTTTYDYDVPDGSGNSSGMISYIPADYNEAIPYAAELPAPKVMYEYVTMQHPTGEQTQYHFNVIKEVSSSGVGFSNFYSIQQKYGEDQINYAVASGDKEVCVSKFVVEDNLASLGQLLSVKTINKQGHVLGEQLNTYYPISEIPDHIGVTQESFQTYKEINYEKPIHGNSNEGTDVLDINGKWFVTGNSRIRYPSILKSTTSISGGYEFTTEFFDYNLISGQARKTRTFDAFGNKLVVESVPAFEKYPEMGSKIADFQNKNMLLQSVYSTSKIFTQNDSDGHLISANIITWNNTWDYLDHAGNSESTSLAGPDVWRKHKEYVWDGAIHAVTGAYEGFTGEDDGFDWTVGVSQSSNSKWKSVSETTRYSHFSAPLEVQDINGNKAATKMGDHHSKIIATANAGYTEMFYSGGEYVVKDAEGNLTDYFDGEVGIGDGILYNYYGAKHTGDTPVTIRSNEETFVVRPGKTGRYKASVWAYDNPEVLTFPTEYVHLKLRVGGTKITYNTQELVRAGDWVLLRFEAEINAGDKVSIVADGDFTATLDDFRLHPIAASMTSYVYNEWDELTYMMGPNGLATKYVYDSQGRLQETWQEVVDTPPSEAYPDGTTGGFKIVSQNEYNYKNR